MFPIVTAKLYDRDGSFIQEVQLTRFWYSPPKILIQGDNYFVRTSDEDTVEHPTYRRTSAVKHIDLR